MPLLSIIVPIYNVEEYLPRCIESILAQVFTDFELILINDGSPDHCDEIMREYANKDERIITIYQDNQGVSAARNAGLKVAQGKYVGFVDPDDWISSYMYSTIIPAMEKSNVDLGIVGFIREKRFDNSVDKELLNKEAEFMDQIKIASELFHVPQSIADSVWNKVFRLEMISCFFDPLQYMCEDGMFVLKYIENIKNGIWINEPLYHVYLRDGSVTRSDSRNYLEALSIKKQMCQRLKGTTLSPIYNIAFNNYFDTCIRVLHMQDKGSESRKRVGLIIWKELVEMIMNPDIQTLKKIKYLYSILMK